MTTILKYGLCISVIFARNKIVFGEIKNEEGISLASVNIVSIPSKIGAQSNGMGYFSEIQEDFTTSGGMIKSIHLKNLINGKLDLSFGSNQLITEDSVRMTFSFQTKSDVQIQAYKYFFGQFENHSGIIFKPLGSGDPIFHRYSTINSSGTEINDQMITFNYLGSQVVYWEYLIHTNSLGLLDINYEVYPVFFIRHDYPSGMIEVLGLDSLENISDNYFRMPSTIEPDLLSMIQNN